MPDKNKEKLAKDLQFYIDNQAKLVKEYDGKYLLIKDQVVIAAFDSSTEAYEEGKKNFELGTFTIQLCSPGKDSYMQSFYSRVIFK